VISWIIIGMLIIVVLFLAKARHIKHKTFIIIFLVLIIFFYFTASKVLSGKNIDLQSFEGIIKAGKIYFSWLIHIAGNTKVMIGNAIKMDWIGNSTIEAAK